jgi:thiol-disulfide isomerase/thioredoxin
MTRRFPTQFLAKFLIGAAVVAVVVLGGVAGIVHYRSSVPNGVQPFSGPLSGAVAHFSLSNPRLPAPAADFRDVDGKEVSLAGFRGRVVLLNFWATWCIPCLKEMPALDRLQGAVGGSDFTVATVSIDRGGAADAKSWFDRNGIRDLPLYLDPDSKAAFAFRASDLPTSVIVDRAGRVVGRMVGPAEWDAPAAKALIRALIAEKS